MKQPAQPLPRLASRQLGARKFYFSQFVCDYRAAFGTEPLWSDLRVFFIYATRKAAFV